jgi:general secretion pathway protein B
MSFILDALRKSENERQRRQTPGLASVPTNSMRKGSSVWVPLVALLVGINLSLILVMWVLSDPSPSPNPTAALSAAGVNGAESAPSINNSPSSRRPPEELSSATDSAAALTDIPPPIYTNSDHDNLPTLAELMFNNSISLPPLHLDIHVYSTEPAERFVFINLSRYNEGEKLSEGPAVVSINKLGVVLRHQGQEFLVTRE